MEESCYKARHNYKRNILVCDCIEMLINARIIQYLMVLIWESGVMALASGRTGNYFYTTTTQIPEIVRLSPKIVSGEGHKDKLSMKVVSQGKEREGRGTKYWANIKNTSNSDVVFKLQVWKTNARTTGRPKPITGNKSKPKPIVTTKNNKYTDSKMDPLT